MSNLNKKLIVSDAGPLIIFGRIDQLALIAQLFESIVIPDVVARECLADISLPGAKAIHKAINDELLTLCPNPVVEENDLFSILGNGEAAAIKLALNMQLPLLIDEKLGRNVAAKLQLKIIGTAGILLLAKRKKIINKVRPLIGKLSDCHYYLSKELIKEILKHADED